MRTLSTLVATFAAVLLAASVFAQASDRATVGKLGQLNQDAPIYQKPHKGSRILYRAKKDTYVAMRSMDAEWVCVVMRDGSNGYIEAQFVTRLPYEVSIKQPASSNSIRSSSPPTSRGGSYRSPNGEWRAWICNEALKYRGTPYVWGGNDLERGIDCSGLVQQLFRMVGIELPRTAAEQSLVGEPITRLEDLQPGDRLYFTNSARMRVTHTGIYMGNGYFIHASRSGGGVNISALEGSWLRTLVGARR